MSAEDMKAEFVSRAKLSEQAERYDDMAEYMRKVTESGLGKSVFLFHLIFICKLNLSPDLFHFYLIPPNTV